MCCGEQRVEKRKLKIGRKEKKAATAERLDRVGVNCVNKDCLYKEVVSKIKGDELKEDKKEENSSSLKGSKVD